MRPHKLFGPINDIAEALLTAELDDDYVLIARIQQEKWGQWLTRRHDGFVFDSMVGYAEMHLSPTAWTILLLNGLAKPLAPGRRERRWF